MSEAPHPHSDAERPRVAVIGLDGTPASYLRSETYIGAHRRFRDGIPAKVHRLLKVTIIESS